MAAMPSPHISSSFQPPNSLTLSNASHVSSDSDLSPSTVALISLTRDISALLSLSVESAASIVHDWFRSSLSHIGIGNRLSVSRSQTTRKGKGETGRGLAVVVLGAGEYTGQTLTLQLARSGYTVFPFLPLPPTSQPQTDTALSSLLLSWSNIQRRLLRRQPHHPGAVIPIITDPEPHSPQWVKQQHLKGKDRFRHAGETVRAYIRENGLDLVAVVCATLTDQNTTGVGLPGQSQGWETGVGPAYDLSGTSVDMGSPTTVISILPPPVPPGPAQLPTVDYDMLEVSAPPVPLGSNYTRPGLLSSDESTLVSLYRANVLDPIAAVKELGDLLKDNNTRKSRLVFVTAVENIEGSEQDPEAMRVVMAARKEAIELMRAELSDRQVDVSEVICGPLHQHRSSVRLSHARTDSEESSSSSQGSMLLTLPLSAITDASQQNTVHDKEAIVQSRLQLLVRLWAVDDALLYSSVRRAMEDEHPRRTHHAGLSPLVGSIVEMIPGSGWGKMIGRWVLGRLLSPRR